MLRLNEGRQGGSIGAMVRLPLCSDLSLPVLLMCDCGCALCLLCSISDDRGYLSIRAGMWAGYELSVTRALGHKHLAAYGVLCEPTVQTLQLQPEDACLVSEREG